MSRKFLGCAFAGVLVAAATVAAQNPPPQQTPPAKPSAAQDTAATVTVEGCLAREADVPGRKANIAERAGVAEDYILTSTKMIKGTAPSAGAAQPSPGETPTGTAGMKSGLLYEVEGISNDELKQNVGRRVQIDGTFDNVERAQRQTPGGDLVQLKGTVIRQVTGECPAPAPAK